MFERNRQKAPFTETVMPRSELSTGRVGSRFFKIEISGFFGLFGGFVRVGSSQFLTGDRRVGSGRVRGLVSRVGFRKMDPRTTLAPPQTVLESRLHVFSMQWKNRTFCIRIHYGT
jgi:hypothetical protein